MSTTLTTLPSCLEALVAHHDMMRDVHRCQGGRIPYI